MLKRYSLKTLFYVFLIALFISCGEDEIVLSLSDTVATYDSGRRKISAQYSNDTNMMVKYFYNESGEMVHIERDSLGVGSDLRNYLLGEDKGGTWIMDAKTVDDKIIYEIERELGFIVSTEIVDYKNIFSIDKVTATGLIKLQKEKLFPIMESYNGKSLLDPMSPELFVIFDNAANAINFSIEVQEDIRNFNVKKQKKNKNKDKKDVFDPDLRYKMGIHFGRVIKKDTQVFGDDMIIANQMRFLSESGGIVISNSIRSILMDDVEFMESNSELEIKPVGDNLGVEYSSRSVQDYNSSYNKFESLILKKPPYVFKTESYKTEAIISFNNEALYSKVDLDGLKDQLNNSPNSPAPFTLLKKGVKFKRADEHIFFKDELNFILENTLDVDFENIEVEVLSENGVVLTKFNLSSVKSGEVGSTYAIYPGELFPENIDINIAGKLMSAGYNSSNLDGSFSVYIRADMRKKIIYIDDRGLVQKITPYCIVSNELTESTVTKDQILRSMKPENFINDVVKQSLMDGNYPPSVFRFTKEATERAGHGYLTVSGTQYNANYDVEFLDGGQCDKDNPELIYGCIQLEGDWRYEETPKDFFSADGLYEKLLNDENHDIDKINASDIRVKIKEKEPNQILMPKSFDIDIITPLDYHSFIWEGFYDDPIKTEQVIFRRVRLENTLYYLQDNSHRSGEP
tara:strand:- start:1793 stop:3847 length:2055 start_codon:yes stop_codon:yes gene_type:complete